MTRSKNLTPYCVPHKISVRGATAPDGRPFVRICASGKKAWISREAFAGNGRAALGILQTAGIPLLSKEWSNAQKQVANLIRYPVRPLLCNTGWNGDHFALVDGTVFSPDRTSRSIALFPKDTESMKTSGKLKHWRAITAELEGQHLATFILLIPFAGPLVGLSQHFANPGFEIAGPGGSGKSTVLRLAAAVCGPTDNAQGPNYWITANTTINGLERVMRDHNDTTVIMDEANLYAAADHITTRAAKFNELVFRLAEGTEKRRHRAGEPSRARFVFLTSTNEPLAQLLAGCRVNVAEAAADRLLTVPISHEREFGVFDWLPRKWTDAAAFADYLSAEVRKVYGVGFRRFIRRVVIERESDQAEFDICVRALIEKFRSIVGVDKNSGSETRVADSFGLIYAAGVLALKYKAISRKLDPLVACEEAYRLNRGLHSHRVDHVKKLLELSDQYETPWIRSDRLAEWSDADLEDSPCILRERPGGFKEILFTDSQLIRAFPDLRSFNNDPQVRQIRISENGRRKSKRQVRSNRGPERFHIFRMPLVNN